MCVVEENFLKTQVNQSLATLAKKCSEHLAIHLPKALKIETEDMRKQLTSSLSILSKCVSQSDLNLVS